MATPRSGFGLPTRPNEGLRAKRMREPSPLLSPPRISSGTGKQEPEGTRVLPKASSQPRFGSGVHESSSRRPSIPQPTTRSTLNQQVPSWASSSTTTLRSRTTSRGGSGSSSSGRSVDSTIKSTATALRRKKPSLSGDLTSARSEPLRTTSDSSIPTSRGSLDPVFGIHLDRDLTASPAEIQVAEVVEIRKPLGNSPIIYPELDRYRDVRRPSYSDVGSEVPFRLATHDLPPPTPASLLFSGTSGSPSTRFSESPGPGSYSRDTTPTSNCSQSPGLVAPLRFNQSKGRLNSPSQTRPPVTRRRAGSFNNEFDVISADRQGLAAVRESLNSSSSNSTVRETDRAARDKKAKKLSPPPPSPPPRKSSHKFHQNQAAISSEKSATSPVKASRPTYPQQTLSPRTQPPSRPSRDGTPDIQSQLFDPVPIIHSNLSSQSLPYERRGSESASTSSLSKPSTHYSATDGNASTSRLPTGKASVSSSQAAWTADTKKSTAETPRITRTPSPHVTSTFNTRFPFFSRKKPPTESTQTDKKEKDSKKTSRKGPAAGTGHEGYGRIGAARRRSGSASTLVRGSPGGQTSQESLSSQDAFLSERINPVIIAGGEIVENRNASSDLVRTDSDQSLTNSQRKLSSDTSSSSRQASRNTLWPSAMERTPHTSLESRRPSQSSDSEVITMKSTLAFRRSVQRLRSSPDSPLRLPQPINTSGQSSSPMTSFDTSVMSDDSHFDLQREISNSVAPLHPAPKKLVKRPRSPRKWNLFSRSQNQSALKNGERVTATVKSVEKKSVAFYMIDSSEQEDSEPMNVQEALRKANVFGDSPRLGSSPETKTSVRTDPGVQPLDKKGPQKTVRPQGNPAHANKENPRPKQATRAKSALVQPPKSRLQAGNKTVAQRPAFGSPPAEKVKQVVSPPSTLSSGRPSRLPQVGRIPKVTNNRPEHISPKSFSRPFRRSFGLAPKPTVIYDEESIAKGPSPPKPSTPVPELTTEGSTIGSGTNVPSSSDSHMGISPDLNPTEKEFLSFSPRKNSDGTLGTSSSSSGAYAFSSATAIVPNPTDPPAEDEIWDEYDDLLGEDNQKAPASASSSKGVPFHLETYQSRLAKEKPMESPTIILDDRKASTYSKATTRSSNYSADMTERIRTAFQPHPSPSTPFSVSEFVSGYGQRNNSTELSPKLEASPRRSQSPRKERKSDASCDSDHSSPLAQVNLRVGSMTVSKWLTFGHVLFSDVRHDLVPITGSLKRHSILVIDGLGNDDWSFYAAETYPAATFFNLSPRAPLPTELQTSPSTFPLSPPNHHQIQYMSHMEKFPFAPQSFTSVVYRFPVAAPEAYYRNILSEARRVLKPGGYIEMSILDVDLNNMGNRGRRTVRRLKEEISDKTPDINLSSTADLVVRLLGKAGFSNIKAARVGVPVASGVVNCDNAKDKSQNAASSTKKRDQPSLAEMMSDNSPLADEGITKMVSRVGRWWYTRCYESATELSDGKSIWNDKSLLRECEELGTSLKLMVCYARAPDRITSC